MRKEIFIFTEPGIRPGAFPVAWLFACIFLLAAGPVLAEEEELFFKSDYQRQIREEQILLLQGNVEVHFRDAIIYADEVRLNDEKNEFFGVGNIRLVTQDRDIFGDSIWYNYSRDDFDMRNARGSMLVNNVSEPVWFEAERLRGNVEDYKMINGKVTTCTPEERREYHVEARSIKVLPDNKIIFRNGYYFLLNVPVLWFPYWSYSLAETPWTVKVGKDSFKGTYVQTTYNYLDEELIIGTLLMDYYSRKGYLLGAEHKYVLPRHGTGSLRWTYNYSKYKREDTGEVHNRNEYRISLSQSLSFGERFTGNFSFNTSSSSNFQGTRTNDNSGSFNSSYNTADSRTSLNLSMSRTSGTSRQSSRIGAKLQYTRKFFEDVNVNANLEYSVDKSNNSGPADEKFRSTIKFNQNQQGWNWSAVFDSHWDPDGFTNIRDRSIRYTDKLPEINVRFNRNAFPGKYKNILGFQMNSLDLLGGLYYIGPEMDEEQGFYGRFDTKLSRQENFGDHRFQSNIDYWQAISSTGDARFVYSTRVNWTWSITDKINWSMGWDRTDEEGNIPFTGLDRPASPRNNSNLSINLQKWKGWTVRLSTSYNLAENWPRQAENKWDLLYIKRLNPLQINITYDPSQKLRATMNTSYNFVTHDWGNLRSTFRMTDNRSYQVNSTINFDVKGGNLQNASLTTFSTDAVFVIGENWDFNIKTEFVPRQGEDYIRELGITHRLDCTFLRLQYRTSTREDEFFIVWGVTAFPTLSLSYSSGQQAFGPDFFNSFTGYGSGFQTGGGFNLGGSSGWGGGSQYGGFY